MGYERLKKEERPVLALCYDFDRTLSPDDMQAQGFIQSVGEDVKEFWRQSNELAEKNDMDMNLAYMLAMVKKAKGKFYVAKKALAEYGAKIKLYDGVEGVVRAHKRVRREPRDNRGALHNLLRS